MSYEEISSNLGNLINMSVTSGNAFYAVDLQGRRHTLKSGRVMFL